MNYEEKEQPLSNSGDSKSIDLYRDARIFRNDADQDARTVSMSFASDLPVARYGWEIGEYEEVLEISENAIDFDRLRDNGPLLVDHDPTQHIGVIEKAHIEDGKAKAVVRLGKSAGVEKHFRFGLKPKYCRSRRLMTLVSDGVKLIRLRFQTTTRQRKGAGSPGSVAFYGWVAF